VYTRYHEQPFADADMRHTLTVAGQGVWWVPSRLCSCFSYYHGTPERALVPDPACTQHDDNGYQYLPAQWITGSILQRIQQKIVYHEAGQDVLGQAEWLIFPQNMDGSPNPAYLGISDNDLIIAPESTTTVTEPLAIGQTQLSRPIVHIVSISLGATLLDPALYTVDQGRIRWAPDALTLGGIASVTWQYHPIYRLLTAMPSMEIFAARAWPRTVYLQERVVMGYQLWQALAGKVPGWI
jgi:hypothetical protein